MNKSWVPGMATPLTPSTTWVWPGNLWGAVHSHPLRMKRWYKVLLPSTILCSCLNKPARSAGGDPCAPHFSPILSTGNTGQALRGAGGASHHCTQTSHARWPGATRSSVAVSTHWEGIDPYVWERSLEALQAISWSVPWQHQKFLTQRVVMKTEVVT